MEHVSVTKLRKIIRLKNWGFFEMPELALIVQLYLLSLCLCVCVPVLDYRITYWWGCFFPSFLHHLVSGSDWMGCYLLVIFWPLFSHYPNAVLRWEFFFYPREFRQLSPLKFHKWQSVHIQNISSSWRKIISPILWMQNWASKRLISEVRTVFECCTKWDTLDLAFSVCVALFSILYDCREIFTDFSRNHDCLALGLVKVRAVRSQSLSSCILQTHIYVSLSYTCN